MSFLGNPSSCLVRVDAVDMARFRASCSAYLTDGCNQMRT